MHHFFGLINIFLFRLLYPVADNIYCQLTITHIAMILRIFLVGEQTEGQRSHIFKHIYLASDQCVIDKMVAVGSKDKHILLDHGRLSGDKISPVSIVLSI